MNQRIMIAPFVSVLATGLSFINIDLGSIAFCTMPLFYLSHRLVDSESEKQKGSIV
jgi:hypothetical protein